MEHRTVNSELTKLSTRQIFIVAYPQSGADLLLEGLRRIDGIACLAHSNVAVGLASLMRISARAELPGLHWLVGAHLRSKLTRQLADGIFELLARDDGVLFEYSYGNITYLTLLRALFPEASYIHVTRRPVYTITGREAWRRKRAHSIMRLCSDWAKIQRAVLASVAAAKHITVRYEDLVAAPAEALSSIATLADIQVRETDVTAFTEAVGRVTKPVGRAVARDHSGLRGLLLLPCHSYIYLLRWAIDTYTREECSLLGYKVTPTRGRLQFLTARFILSCIPVSGSKGRAAWRN